MEFNTRTNGTNFSQIDETKHEVSKTETQENEKVAEPQAPEAEEDDSHFDLEDISEVEDTDFELDSDTDIEKGLLWPLV